MQRDRTATSWRREDLTRSYSDHSGKAHAALERAVFLLEQAFEMAEKEPGGEMYRDLTTFDPGASPSPTLEHLGELFQLLQTVRMCKRQLADLEDKLEYVMGGFDLALENRAVANGV
jgi:hypothetical protein